MRSQRENFSIRHVVDFTGMGPVLIKKLLKELQSSIGFYEVQTGQSIGQVMATGLSSKQACWRRQFPTRSASQP